MSYNVKYEKQARKTLKKMDKFQSSMIISWIEKNLIGTENPKVHGKDLVGNKSGLWRYRVGDYRIIADIQEETVTILIVNIGHRRDIYN
ncbi:MAG TPA: type II toxin-antitoxin system RelE/ParE family toxin [Candidatus Tetragenococcus pullicola]|nr:type II toxin-antitoxin system RelE/ParE family toxin [Candidatus Tetragenococcus pullicola]